MSLRLAVLAACGLCITPVSMLAAQPGQPQSRFCDGLNVSEIVITPDPPFVGGILERWQFVSRLVNRLHVTSNEDLIRRFLALEEGKPCSELRRAESERILRVQPFLATASVETESDGEGGVRVLVVTTDEISAVFSASPSTSQPIVRQLKVGEGNLMGEGIYTAAEWRAGTFGRDGYALRFVDHQLFARPYQLALEGVRQQLGGHWSASLAHPYFTDLQRVAWSVSAGERTEYINYTRPEEYNVAVVVDRGHGEIGGVLRLGPPGRLSLFGASVSMEQTSAVGVPVLVTDSGTVAQDSLASYTNRFGSVKASRLNALWGVRNVRFMRAAGFDALTAVQDVRVGFEAGALVGRSLASLGSDEDDLFVSADMYAGMGSPRSFLSVDMHGEARQDFDTDRWDSVIGSGRLMWYFHAVPRHTMVTSGEWSAGWTPRVPLALELGAREGGVRGYRRSGFVGQRRAVVRTEQRWYIGQFKESAQYGAGVFADVGQIWAGDALFGVNSGPKAGVGVSVFAAIPPRSQRMWRVDVAMPVTKPYGGAGIEFRLSSVSANRRRYELPYDLLRSRAHSVPTSIFRWP